MTFLARAQRRTADRYSAGSAAPVRRPPPRPASRRSAAWRSRCTGKPRRRAAQGCSRWPRWCSTGSPIRSSRAPSAAWSSRAASSPPASSRGGATARATSRPRRDAWSRAERLARTLLADPAKAAAAGPDPGRAVLPQRADLDALGRAAPAHGADRAPHLLSLTRRRPRRTLTRRRRAGCPDDRSRNKLRPARVEFRCRDDPYRRALDHGPACARSAGGAAVARRAAGPPTDHADPAADRARAGA